MGIWRGRGNPLEPRSKNFSNWSPNKDAVAGKWKPEVLFIWPNFQFNCLKANGKHRSNGNFLEHMNNLQRCYTFPIPTSKNGNYHSICTKFYFYFVPIIVTSLRSFYLPIRLQVWNEWKKPFHLTWKSFWNVQFQKISILLPRKVFLFCTPHPLRKFQFSFILCF